MMRASNGRRILPAYFSLAPLAMVVLGSWPALGSLIPVSPLPEETRIRVRLTEGTSVVQVRGFDLKIFQGSSNRKPAFQASRESDWELRCQDGRVRAKRVSGDGVGEGLVELPEPVILKSPAGFLQYHGKPFHEELSVHTVGSLCEVVNEVDLEKYLEGLVNAEFSSKWNEEAIGAQVVAARTYALYQIHQARAEADRNYDVDNSTYDQVYAGSIKEDTRAARIVEKTRGWILSVDGKPLKAYYSANCGGMTELPHAVWGSKDTGFRRVKDPFCAYSPGAHWSFDLSTSRILQALRKAGRNPTTDLTKFPRDWKKLLQGQLRSMQVTKLDLSGRVEQIVLSFNVAGQIREWPISGARFREWMGAAQFKSTSFQLQLASSGGQLLWRFSGRGNGHGVGMCQWGAKSMGERGFKTAAILKYYYPDAQLRKLW